MFMTVTEPAPGRGQMLPRTAAALLLVFSLIILDASAQNFGMPGADRYFRLEWQARQSARWGPQVAGYLYNDYGAPATNVRLLVETLDGAGAVTGSTVTLVPGTAPGGGRLYFEQRVPAAAGYRLRVLSWDFVRGGAGF
jgi:hypothetical protein